MIGAEWYFVSTEVFNIANELGNKNLLKTCVFSVENCLFMSFFYVSVALVFSSLIPGLLHMLRLLTLFSLSVTKRNHTMLFDFNSVCAKCGD